MKIPEIKETYDYSIFKRLEGNRDVKQVKAIIDSIKKIGYLFNPIMCNEKMEIIDGQNRLEACKTLKLPMYYYTVKGIGIDEAIALNLGRTNWKPINYAKSYAEQGRESYILLMKLANDFPWFKFQEVISVAANTITTNGWVYRGVSEGTYELTKENYEIAREKLNILNDMQETLVRIIGVRRLYISCIAWTLSVKGLDVNRFIKVLNEKYPLLRPACDADIFLKDLSDIYNKGLDKKKQMYFDFEYNTR